MSQEAGPTNGQVYRAYVKVRLSNLVPRAAGFVATLALVWLVLTETGLWPWEVARHLPGWYVFGGVGSFVVLSLLTYFILCWSLDFTVRKVSSRRRAAVLAVSIVEGYNPWEGLSPPQAKDHLLRIIYNSMSSRRREPPTRQSRGGRNLRLCREVATALHDLLSRGDEILPALLEASHREAVEIGYVPIERVPWMILTTAQLSAHLSSV